MVEGGDWLAILRCMHALTNRYGMDKFQNEGHASIGRFIHSLVALANDGLALSEIFPGL